MQNPFVSNYVTNFSTAYPNVHSLLPSIISEQKKKQIELNLMKRINEEKNLMRKRPSKHRFGAVQPRILSDQCALLPSNLYYKLSKIREDPSDVLDYNSYLSSLAARQ